MMDASPLRPLGDRWRLLPFSDAPMGRQLGLSEGMLAALEETGIPALRWYMPRERALVLGNAQSPAITEAAALSAHGVALYKRPSGGTAVLVDAALVSLDLALPHTHPLATSDVVRAYEWIGEVWAEALRSLGVSEARALPTAEARAVPKLDRNDPLQLACYGTLSPWEVVVGAPPRKLVGLCQTRRRPGALYQTGAYLRLDSAALANLLAIVPDARDALATRLAHAAIGLDEVSGARLEAQAVIAAFERTLNTRLHATLIPADWLPSELAHAERLIAERFHPLV